MSKYIDVENKLFNAAKFNEDCIPLHIAFTCYNDNEILRFRLTLDGKQVEQRITWLELSRINDYALDNILVCGVTEMICEVSK